MFKDLSLYYLQQMGIQPWVLRATVAQNEQPKLIIIHAKSFNANEKILLQHMMYYLNLDENDYLCLVDPLGLASYQPMAVFAPGMSSAQALQTSSPVFFGPSLESLLDNPGDKSKILPELMAMRTLVNVKES